MRELVIGGTLHDIEVTEHGPYRVSGDVVIRDTEGNLLRHGGTWRLCRCGGSRSKPFCDATHGVKGFDVRRPPITARSPAVARAIWAQASRSTTTVRSVALATLAERT